MQYILGIDIGTGSTKAVSVSASGQVLHTEQVSYPTLTPQPHYSEQDPELIWQALLQCISLTVVSLKHAPAAISLSSAMHSVIPVDATGHALMNMMTWADNRSGFIAEKIRNSAQGQTLYERSGTPIHAMSPLCKIMWMQEHARDIYDQTTKFISIKEYVWFRLFGVFEIDHSIASATGLFDIEKLCWNETSLLTCGLLSDRLSVPVSTTHHRVLTDQSLLSQTGLPDGVPFFIGASDGCLANLGSFATEPGIAALTIGTSGAIRVGNKQPTVNFKAMTFNYRLDEDTFISGGPINNGGAALKWYVQNFLKKENQDISDYSQIIDETLSIPPGSNGLLFLPYILGERAPLWNTDACGVFFGITIQHHQEHFTKAVLEGITMSLFNIAHQLEESGLRIQQVNVSGGFVHSETWVQLLADIFGKPVGLLNREDASAIGAAYLAMKKLGMINDYADLKPSHINMYLPDMNRHRCYLETIFPMFRNLTDRLMLDMAVISENRSLQA